MVEGKPSEVTVVCMQQQVYRRGWAWPIEPQGRGWNEEDKEAEAGDLQGKGKEYSTIEI